MAVNQSGIAITIKAFLPTGKTLDETFAALSIVKAAHETSDYSALLAAAIVDEVKTEQKTRRVEAQAAPQAEPVAEPEPQPEPAADPDLEDLPEAAPEGEPSLQDVADYGTDDEPETAVEFNHEWLTPTDEEAEAEAAPPRKAKKS